MMFKAVSGIMLTLLLIGMLTLAFDTQSVKADPNTIYVDDDNISGPWDGTPEHPYQNIISALEHASANDTIYVYNGTYYENVIVDKSINLIGEDRNSTIIDGSGTHAVFWSCANCVNISGFTCMHASF
jgi:pectin methylesterase-like acyl-CoA thioesterase